MIDVTKPIRRKDNQVEAVLVASDLDGPWPYEVRYRLLHGWSAYTYTPEDFEDKFENVPPPTPRREKVWLYTRADLPKTPYITPTGPTLLGLNAVGSAWLVEGEWAEEGDKP